MNFLKIIKSTLLSVGLAVAASSAMAATVASIEVTDGVASIGSGKDAAGADVEALKVTGNFSTFIDLGFDPDTFGDYTLAADLTVNGTEVFNDSLTVTTTATDLLLQAVNIALAIDSVAPGLLLNVFDEAFDGDLNQTEVVSDVWLGVDFNLTDNDILDGTLAGSFTAILSGDEIADPTSVVTGFTPLATFSGSASVSLDNAAVVPLPASAPLLFFAIVGFFGLRRYAKS